MKNVLIGLFILGLTNLSYSQVLASNNFDDNIKKTSKKTSKVRAPLNQSYLNGVQDEGLADIVKNLEDLVSKCDISLSPDYDPNSKQPFRVLFKSSKGSIVANYDKNGEVLTSVGKFENVKLPAAVRTAILKTHKHWVISSIKYSSHYSKDYAPKKIYKIKIQKGNLTKKFKVDPYGNIQ